MTVQRSRVFGGAVAAALGMLGLRAALPGLSILGGGASEVCLKVSPAESWIATHLHVLAASSDCPHGSMAPGEAFSTAVGFSVVISLSMLLVGVAIATAALGFGLAARRLARRARGWWRRRVLPVLLGGLGRPAPVPVPVHVPVRPVRRVRSPRELRGPPYSC